MNINVVGAGTGLSHRAELALSRFRPQPSKAFGGTTQFSITWLIHVTGLPTAPAWYVTATSVISALAMLAMPESRDRQLEDGR
ncbi:MAG: hypothetical protein HIU89_17170 [Proteobacteria bacterium]|nr:hypothetical protein [Pseudomonadota bacterium]